MARPRLPPLFKLTAEIVADESKLWHAINEVLLQVPDYRERRRRIIKAQNLLKTLVSEEALGVYMAIEAATNHRHVTEITFLLRWAFDEGRRSRTGGRA